MTLKKADMAAPRKFANFNAYTVRREECAPSLDFTHRYTYLFVIILSYSPITVCIGLMEELHTDSIDGGHEASYGARSRARERAYSNNLSGLALARPPYSATYYNTDSKVWVS
jgi:hypothetical protein